MGIVDKGRVYRDQKLKQVAKFFLKIGISANLMTAFSLVLGIAAVYFLFKQHYLFVIFALLHLLADGLDGVMARNSTTSKWGKYFDYFTDRLIELLILLKIGWFLQDYYVYIITGIFLVTQTVYLTSKMRFPVKVARTGMTIGLMFNVYPLSYYLNVPTATYLIVGGFYLYGLTKQFQFWLEHRT